MDLIMTGASTIVIAGSIRNAIVGEMGRLRVTAAWTVPNKLLKYYQNICDTGEIIIPSAW